MDCQWRILHQSSRSTFRHFLHHECKNQSGTVQLLTSLYHIFVHNGCITKDIFEYWFLWISKEKQLFSDEIIYRYLILQLPNPLQSSSREVASLSWLFVRAWSHLHLCVPSLFSAVLPPSSSWRAPWSYHRWQRHYPQTAGFGLLSPQSYYTEKLDCRSSSHHCSRHLLGI